MKKPIIQDKDLKLHRLADTGGGETCDPQFIPVGGGIKIVEDGLYFTWCDCPECAIRVFSSYPYPLVYSGSYESKKVKVTDITVTTVTKQLPHPPRDAYQGGRVLPIGGYVQRTFFSDSYTHSDPDVYQGGAVIPTGGRIQNLLANYNRPDPDVYQSGAVIPTGGRIWADLVRYWHPPGDAYAASHVKVEEITLRSR